MTPIEYRQAIYVDGKFNDFHYWGFIDDGHGLGFIGLDLSNCSPQEALKNSEQFTGHHDENGKKIYKNDLCRIMPYSNNPNDEAKYIFRKMIFKVIWNDEECGYLLEEEEYLFDFGEIEIIIVVGNIHEK